MDAERQQVRLYQRLLFEPWESLCPDGRGDGGTEAAASEEPQASTALDHARALTACLMEEVIERANLNRAYRRVMANQGAAGVDGLTVEELGEWIKRHKQALIASLVDGSYRPQPVRGVEIPKPGGGMRQLGIPTAVDRLVQQAILQVLEPILDPTFSASSFGFRPGKSAHQALRQASQYVAEGRSIVVDLDLEKFFDRVNHDLLMARLARRVSDKRLLRIVRRFLQAGLMRQGLCVERHEGTPQGGPLSPLLANLLLDDLDQELARRGHAFCRYADDCNIYVRSREAGQRVLQSLTKFLEGRLKLRVNYAKSAVAHVSERKFLGYRILAGGRLTIAPTSRDRAKQRIRELTCRKRPVELERLIGQLNSFLSGWVTYFRLAQAKSVLAGLDQWLRRRLRCLRLKQRKRRYAIATFLQSLGVPAWRAWLLACSGKGWWRKAGSPQAAEAMNNAWFTKLGLVCLVQRHAALQTQ